MIVRAGFLDVYWKLVEQNDLFFAFISTVQNFIHDREQILISYIFIFIFPYITGSVLKGNATPFEDCFYQESLATARRTENEQKIGSSALEKVNQLPRLH